MLLGCLLVSTLSMAAVTAKHVDDDCLRCLCLAKTGCDILKGCVEGVCGPFAITQPYWIDAGRPVIDGDNPQASGAFERCTQEPFCAAETVQEYFKKYGKDMSSDIGKCKRLAVMHVYGPIFEYSDEISNGEVEETVSCYSRIKSSKGNIETRGKKC